MLFKKIITFFSLTIVSHQLFAQAGTIITGNVTDKSTSQAVEFATIQLLKIPDSSAAKSTVTDKKGKFILENIEPGNYLLRCSFIGFSNTDVPVIIGKQARLNLGKIEILSLTASMKEVTVTGKKAVLNTSIDRKVYNVTQDIMAQSGTASDVLKNIPSVEVDIDGNVSLRGSEAVLILINGRPSPLMGKTRAEVLQQFPANSIERIEVITNPSAKYRPDGTSGIINIVLKKNVKTGWNGNVIANVGNRSRYNGSVGLNYKPGKLNVFGNYSYRQDSRNRLNNTDREYLDSTGNTASYYTENNQSPARPYSHLITLGSDYQLNSHNSFGISGNYHYRKQVKNDVTKYVFYDKNYILSGNYDRLRYDPEIEKESDATAYWQHNFPKEDHELRFELNVSGSNEVEDNHYTNVNYYPVSFSSFDNTVIRQINHQQQLNIEYTNPLSENSKLEAGYSGSFTQLDMNFYGEYYDTTQHKFVKDIVKSNQFLYKEFIHAFYATYQHSYEKFGYEIGLRAEPVNINGNLVTKDSLISNNYFKIFPTVHLSYKIRNSELQLNYSKRVNRAEGDDLNPFPEYRDPRNLRAGNPRLLPEIIHSVEFGYKWQNKNFSFVPSLYYRYKQNGFTTVTIPLNDTVLLTTQQNLSNDQYAGLELIFSAKAGKFFSANLSSNFFYEKIDASSLGYSNRKSIVSMSLNYNSTFVFSPTTFLQLSCNYRSARLTPQGKTFGTFVLNAGMRQDLLKKKMSVILTISDLFKTLQYKTELNSAYLNQTAVGKRDAQIFYLGISYRFGKAVKKSNEVKLQFDNNL
ncbi:MAG: TonB-dependent receptor [Chitinophagaceae bacterium]|nr:TonB-dependent receptor [Chitinophagaceae bacterium]